MAVFIMLTKLTPNGVRTLKDNPGRVHEVNKEVEQLGVKVVDQWATLGEYDFVTVVEADDERAMAKVSVELGAEDVRRIVEAAAAESVDLVVVGPEAPLVAGLVDALEASGIAAFGPSAAAAALEGSKAFMKDLCAREGIPTAG